MSSHEQAIVCLLSNFALAYATVGMIVKLTSGSSALRKLQDAPSVRVSDLWSVLFVEGGSDLKPDLSTWLGMEDLVIVLGLMEAKSAVKGGTWKSLRRNVLVSQDFGDRAMIVQRTQTMSVQEYQVDSIMMDLLERAGRGSARWMPYGFPLKEELRSRLNGQPFTYPSCKLRMGDVVELTPALPDKSLTEYREEIQHIYNRGPTVSSIGPAASTVVG